MGSLKEDDRPSGRAPTSLRETVPYPRLVVALELLDDLNRVRVLLAVEPNVAVLTDQDEVLVVVPLFLGFGLIRSRPLVARRFNVGDVPDDDHRVMLGSIDEQLDAAG